MHGRRRITQIAVGPVPFSHKYVEQQWNNKINICGQHCCTGTKLNVEILPDSASHVRRKGNVEPENSSEANGTNGSADVRLLLPLSILAALVRTKIQPAHGCGNHVFVAAERTIRT